MKSKKYLVIYFNKEMTSFQIVRPTSQFNEDWAGLAEAVTQSNLKMGIKKYLFYKIK